MESLLLPTASELDLDTLRLAAGLEGIWAFNYTLTNADMYEADGRVPVDTSRVKQLASEELARRGLPPAAT